MEIESSTLQTWGTRQGYGHHEARALAWPADQIEAAANRGQTLADILQAAPPAAR